MYILMYISIIFFERIFIMFDLFKKASTNVKAKLTDADIKKIEDTCGILFGKENAAHYA